MGPPVPSPFPVPPTPPALHAVAELLDPVLGPLGFAPGQGGASEGEGQVIFCRGDADSTDGGCVDLVVDLVVDRRAAPAWRIIDVRYWGFPSHTWHLEFPTDRDLSDQLAALVETLPTALSPGASGPELREGR